MNNKNVELGDGEPSPPCESNSITYRAPEVVSDEPEPEKCPICNGYHLGGCHRRSGAAQEVSPPSPRKLADLSTDEIIAQWAHQAKSDQQLMTKYFERAEKAEGDTRELKAALQQAKSYLKAALRLVDENPMTSFHRDAESVIAEAERLLEAK